MGGRFAPLATLVNEDAVLDSTYTHFKKAVSNTATELLGKQRRKRKTPVTLEMLHLCDQRLDLKKKRDKLLRYRTEMKIAKKTYRVIAMKWQHTSNKKAYQLV